MLVIPIVKCNTIYLSLITKVTTSKYKSVFSNRYFIIWFYFCARTVYLRKVSCFDFKIIGPPLQNLILGLLASEFGSK